MVLRCNKLWWWWKSVCSYKNADADANAEISGGAFFFVEQGSANADNGYVTHTMEHQHWY